MLLQVVEQAANQPFRRSTSTSGTSTTADGKNDNETITNITNITANTTTANITTTTTANTTANTTAASETPPSGATSGVVYEGVSDDGALLFSTGS